jgi:phosphoenolpyruvate synthase/pyruvate phosphate dikinase
LEPRIEAALAGLDPEDLAALGSASAGIGDAVRAAPVPEAVSAEIARRYAALGDEPPVAVRSSAVGEDGAEATFAGQQDTFLWVRGAENVCAAVRDCWASLYSGPAISYRARMGAGEAPAMGVTVQLMVDAAVSGVMFTCNPVSGDPSSVVVNASWGLGVAVVGGEVTPDEYRVSKVTREVLQRTIGTKEVEYRPDPAGGTARRDVAASRREESCLDEARLGALVDLARTLERRFGGHQDVEWAIARDGRPEADLFLLQTRPVTAAPAKAEPAPRRSAMSLVMQTFGVTEEGEGER